MSSVYVAKAPPGVEGEELRSVNVNIATQVAIKKLRSGSHEITYPELILNALEEDGMRQLVERISTIVNAQVVSFHDSINSVVRILFPPGYVAPAPNFIEHNAGGLQQVLASPSQDQLAMITQQLLVQPDFAQQILSPGSAQQQVSPPQVVYPPVTLNGNGMDDSTQSNHAAADRPRRPMNCFMLYRQALHPQIARIHPTMSNCNMSKLIARIWKRESPIIKARYKARADKEAEEFAVKYPNYRYKPRKTAEIKKRAKKNKNQSYHVSDAPLNFVAPSILEKIHTEPMESGLNINSDNITPFESGSMIRGFASADRPFVNMSEASRADQLAYGRVLDDNALVQQVCDNLAFEENVARNLSGAINPHEASSDLTSSGAAVSDDDFIATTLRNYGLLAEGALDPLESFALPERDLTTDLSALAGMEPVNFTY